MATITKVRPASLIAETSSSLPMENSVPIDNANDEKPHKTYIYDLVKCPVASCSTAAATATKVCVLSNFQDFYLVDGMQIKVYFMYANTASNVALQVQYTNASGTVVTLDAKSVYVEGTATALSDAIKAGSVMSFTYISTIDAFVCSVPVIDNLSTANSALALSANQGYVLNQTVSNVGCTLEQIVSCTVGDTAITLKTTSAYLLVSSGSNYAKGVFLVTQGYNSGTLVSALNVNGLSATVNSFKNLTISNSGSGTVNMAVLKLRSY